MAGKSPVWARLRWGFLALLWLGVLMGAVVIWALWRKAPGRILGVSWIWFAGAAWVALAVVALDAVLELSSMPLPPEVPPRHEVAQWMLFLVLGPLVAVMFAFDVGILVVVHHAASEVFSWLPPGGQLTVLTAIWIAWFMGTFYVLALVGGSSWSAKFRRTLRYRLLGLHTLEADILHLLDTAALPDEVKATFARPIRRRGMTPEIARELLLVLETHSTLEGSNISRAMLAQSLHNWLEEHDSGSR